MTPLSETDRSVLRQAIVYARDKDKQNLGWTDDRDGDEYIDTIGDLHGVRSYLIDANLPKRVLDVGVGKGLYLGDLQEFFKDFEISGTALSPNQVDPTVKDLLPPIKIHYRTVERLLGRVPRDHFGAILSVVGLCYSPVPDQTLRAMDQLLAPGGVLKMRGYTQRQMQMSGSIKFPATMQDIEYYHDKLLFLGYDVATDSVGTLAAIKPFGDPQIMAVDLL